MTDLDPVDYAAFNSQLSVIADSVDGELESEIKNVETALRELRAVSSDLAIEIGLEANAGEEATEIMQSRTSDGRKILIAGFIVGAIALAGTSYLIYRGSDQTDIGGLFLYTLGAMLAGTGSLGSLVIGVAQAAPILMTSDQAYTLYGEVLELEEKLEELLSVRTEEQEIAKYL